MVKVGYSPGVIHRKKCLKTAQVGRVNTVYRIGGLIAKVELVLGSQQRAKTKKYEGKKQFSIHSFMGLFVSKFWENTASGLR